MLADLGNNAAAKMLGIHVGELNEWLLSGVLRDLEITPPRPDDRRGTGKFSGYELAIVQERMKEAGLE
ncbi:MAG: hypothetical protein ACRC7D_00030 [Aeromonas popoffii]|uniref:hypothetical protein n=1 Tax=Aeromonas popoffii TaxID=70856 RepID=UPI003F335101